MRKLQEYFKDQLNFEAACKLIGTSEVEIQSKLEKLNNWYIEQKHLPCNGLDKAMMLKFLLGTKGDSEEAGRRIDSYFTVRNYVQSIFLNRDPQEEGFLAANAYMYIGILPGLTPDGSRVAIFRLRQDDPAMMDFPAILKRTFCTYDVWLKTDPFSTRLYVIVDISLGRFGHSLRVSIMRLREAFYCFQNVYPIRIQGFIFINTPSFARTFAEFVVKPLFKKKLSKRFLVYAGDHSELYKTIPLSMLPSDYGGEGPSLESMNQNWIAGVNRHRDWLMTAGTLSSDESARDETTGYDKKSTCVVM